VEVLRSLWPYAVPALMLIWVLAFVVRKTPGIGRVEASTSGKVGLAIAVCAAGISLTWLPVFPAGQVKLSFGSWVLSANPGFSTCSLAMAASSVRAALWGTPLLRRRDMVLLSLWLVLLATILYSSIWGLLSYDLYAQGYGFSWWFWITGMITLFLGLLGQARLALVGIAVIATYDLRLLPSDNLFDYLIDGPAVLFACLYLIYQSFRDLRERIRRIPH